MTNNERNQMKYAVIIEFYKGAIEELRKEFNTIEEAQESANKYKEAQNDGFDNIKSITIKEIH